MGVSPLRTGKEDDKRDIDVLVDGSSSRTSRACEIGGCRGFDCRETVFDGVSAGAA